MSRELLKLVLESVTPSKSWRIPNDLKVAIQSELAKPEPEPVKYEFQDDNGKWCRFIDDLHYQMTVKAGHWPIRALYTTPPDQSEKIAELELELTRQSNRLIDANGDKNTLLSKLKDANYRIAELEQKITDITDSNIDKILTMSAEQISALHVIEGHNPDDVAKLGRFCAETALLKIKNSELERQLIDATNELSLLRIKCERGMCGE